MRTTVRKSYNPVLREAGKEAGVLYYPIGGTVFKVCVRFSEDAAETMEDKIIRMMQLEDLILKNQDGRIARRKWRCDHIRSCDRRFHYLFIPRPGDLCYD